MSMTLTLTGLGQPTDHLQQNDGSLSGEINTREVRETREAELVVFENTTQGLGLKICGGCSPDGKEEHGIFVKRVLPGGLAESSDCIQSGDLILEVNKQSMEGITYERAISMLRQASASNHVEIVVTRDDEARLYFANYMSLYGSTPSPSPRNINSTATQESNYATDGNVDFQRKMNAFLKDANLDLDSSGEQIDPHASVRVVESNGHISPASSTASEMANHLGEAGISPRNHQPANKNYQNISIDGLDSLLSKKLSQDPGLRLHIDQLESAMIKLGFDFPPAMQQAVRERLSVDSNGTVKFEEFVQVAKGMFHKDLGALKGRITPHSNHDLLQSAGMQTANYATVVKERDVLLAEVAALKEELQDQRQSCQIKEDQLLFIRKQMQVVIEEGRSLKSKLHLAEQAQARAQQTEHDYEEVVAMLENEVSQLRLQSSKSDGTSMQKRLAVLVCQLKKSESGKKTYEVATEKLIKHVEHSLEVLSSVENSPRGPEGLKTKGARKKALSNLSSEGRDVIKTVRSLMEAVPLPFGWEEAYTSDGVRYYINHMNQTTTWTHPVSCMEHQTNTKTSAGKDNPSSSTQIMPPPPPPLPPSLQPSSEAVQSFPPSQAQQTLPQDQQTTVQQGPSVNDKKKKEDMDVIDINISVS